VAELAAARRNPSRTTTVMCAGLTAQSKLDARTNMLLPVELARFLRASITCALCSRPTGVVASALDAPAYHRRRAFDRSIVSSRLRMRPDGIAMD
jgi:hypothetical protein